MFRNPVASANKWRTELTPDQQRTILDITRQTALARYWPETAEAPAVAA